MACNCGKKNGGTNYLYVAPDGQQQVYTTEVQAQVAKIKNGGGTITPVAK